MHLQTLKKIGHENTVMTIKCNDALFPLLVLCLPRPSVQARPMPLTGALPALNSQHGGSGSPTSLIGGGNGAHFSARTSCPVLATRFLLPKLLSGRHSDTPVLVTGLPPGSLPCHFTDHSLTAGISNKDLCL